MTHPIPTTVALEPDQLTFAQVVAVARFGAQVTIPEHVKAAVASTRTHVEALAQAERPVYGVSTGFGALAQRHIPHSLRAQLQKSLIRSHAAGMGEPVEPEVVRALMLLRARTLATGRTGIKLETLETYVKILNAGITPWVQEFGSLGCSGDLAPLAACALVVMGEGQVHTPSKPTPAQGAGTRPVEAASALKEAGITPVQLEEKEGLALINGTDGMLGMLILALHDLEMLLTTADVTAAMSVEGQLGTDQVFRADLHMPLRPHPGQAASAANMRAALAGSPIVASHKDSTHLVQDAYSLRCSPQVTGAARDAATFAAMVASRELRAAIDNPVVLPSGEVSSNGNFHGAPLAQQLDFLAISVADVASNAERRTDRFMDPARNQGLNPFLADDPGVDSGLMIAHYTQVSLVAELKRLAVPASVDSIPSSAMQEDHVSLGWSAARKLRTAVDHLARVLAVELYAAARAVELRGASSGDTGAEVVAGSPGAAPGAVTGAVVAALREVVPGPGPDRYLSPELAETYEFVRAGRVVTVAEAAAGGAGEGGLMHTFTDTDGAVLPGV